MEILNFFNKTKIRSTVPFVLLILVLIVIYLPSFRLNFSLLDDGLTAKNAHMLAESISSLNTNKIVAVLFEPENGRVRPAYWLTQSILVWVSSYSPTLMHIYRFLILLVTVFVVNKILANFKVNQTIRIFVIFVYAVNFQNLENYYRLGPTEPFLALYYIFLVYLLFFVIKDHLTIKNVLLFSAIFLLGAFTKESFFLIAAPWIIGFFIYSFFNKKATKSTKKVILILLTTMLSALIIFAIKNSYPEANNYASNYVVNISQFLLAFNAYKQKLLFYQPLLVQGSIAYFFYFMYKLGYVRKFKNISISETFLIIAFLQVIVQLAVLLPWKFALDRYLVFVNINLVFIYSFLFMEIYDFIESKIFAKWQFFLGLLLFALSAQFIVRNFFAIANYQLFQQVDSEISKRSIQMIANRVPSGETVYVNYKKGDSNIEIFKAAKWHLEEFYGRGDIQFEYVDINNLCTEDKRYVFDRRSDRYVSTEAFTDAGLSVIEEGVSVYRPVNYGIVIRSFYYKKKLPNWDDEYLFDWSLYIQAPNTCIKEEYIL